MQTRQRRSALGPVALLAVASLFSAGCGGGGSNGAATGTPTVNTPTPPAPPTVVVPTHFTTIDGPAGGPTTLNGISNAGAVVGYTTTNGTNANFLRSASGTVSPLNVGDPAGVANAVNAGGTVVGAANNGAFVLTGGTATPLTAPNGAALVAYGINDGGTVVGSYVANSAAPGFVDVGGTFTTVTPTTAATATSVQGVNTAGVAVGFYSAAGSTVQHGFLYDTGTRQTTLLPDPDTAHTASAGLALTQFLGINDSGETVGYYQTNSGSQYGFLFSTATRAYTYLDEPLAAPVGGVQVTQITGVNNAGTICGFYIDAGGVQHGFTATP